MNLPGSIHPVTPGTPCEDCDNGTLADVLLQGETDSMGAEYHPLCNKCRLQRVRESSSHISKCDRCGKERETRPWRDWEEGSSGPVYYICMECRHKANEYDRKQFEEALELMGGIDEELDDICPCGRINCVEEDGHYDMLEMEDEQ